MSVKLLSFVFAAVLLAIYPAWYYSILNKVRVALLACLHKLAYNDRNNINYLCFFNSSDKLFFQTNRLKQSVPLRVFVLPAQACYKRFVFYLISPNHVLVC